MRFSSLVGNSFGCSASGERLVSAARDGDFQEAKALLGYNPRLARYSTFGSRNLPLHHAAAQGHHEIVSLLIESRVDINLRNHRGQTALMHACEYGRWEAVLILVLFKANIHKTDCNGATALHLAALNGHSRCIRILLADYVPSIPKFYKFVKKRSRIQEFVSESNEGNSLYDIINRAADGGVTALHMAALNGHVDSLHLLVDLGASVNEVTVEDGTTIDLIGAGSTPLHYAAYGGNPQCCQILIAKGASVTAENAKGWSPLEVARSWNRYWLAEILSMHPQERIITLPSPYLCLPLMSVVKIARQCGLKGDSNSNLDDPCAVCLENKCTVAASDCLHELCTRCALYLCSTNTSCSLYGPPGSIPCPLCRHAIISFKKLASTQTMKPSSSSHAAHVLQCPRSTIEPHKKQLPYADRNPLPRLLNSQTFTSLKVKPNLCMRGLEISPSLVRHSMGRRSLRAQLARYSRSSFQMSNTNFKGRKLWLCPLDQSVETPNTC